MIALAYLLSVLVAVGALAVALRPRRVPAPPRPTIPPALPGIEPGTELRVILTAAAQLADRLAPAA